MIERIDQEGRVGPYRPDRAVLQHLGQQFARFLAIFAPRDDLGDHRVVEGRDFGAFIDAGIHAAAMLGKLEEFQRADRGQEALGGIRSEEHTSELQSLMRISYAVFCLKKKKNKYKQTNRINKIE